MKTVAELDGKLPHTWIALIQLSNELVREAAHDERHDGQLCSPYELALPAKMGRRGMARIGCGARPPAFQKGAHKHLVGAVALWG
jgi:hypothetical protein